MQGASSDKADIYICIGTNAEGMRDLMAVRDERIARGAFSNIDHEYLRLQQDSFPIASIQSEIEDYRARFPHMVVRQVIFRKVNRHER